MIKINKKYFIFFLLTFYKKDRTNSFDIGFSHHI